jgi:hypothetical protein
LMYNGATICSLRGTQGIEGHDDDIAAA